MATLDLDALAADFYRRAFAGIPSLSAMFTSDPARAAGAVRRGARRDRRARSASLDSFASRAGPLGARHRGYGVRARHYRLMGDALLAALAAAPRAMAGPTTSAEAWTLAYNLTAETMMIGCEEGRLRGDVGWSASAPASWRRPDTPSFEYTFCRWLLTVRTDRNSWSAISLLDSPCAASVAMSRSRAGERRRPGPGRSAPACAPLRRRPASVGAPGRRGPRPRGGRRRAGRPGRPRWRPRRRAAAAPHASKRSASLDDGRAPAAGAAAWRGVRGDEVSLALAGQLAEAIGDRRRIAEADDVVEQPGLGRRGSRGDASQVGGGAAAPGAAPGQIAGDRRRPRPAELLLGLDEGERRAAGRARATAGAPRRRRRARRGRWRGADSTSRCGPTRCAPRSGRAPRPASAGPSPTRPRQQRAPAELVAEPHERVGRRGRPVSPRRRPSASAAASASRPHSVSA